MRESKSINIQQYKKKWNINIGIILFGAIFIYLLVAVFLYLTAKHVSAYEVREGTILRDNALTGIALREESVIASDTEGYINYYSLENSKIAVGSNIYTITANKEDAQKENQDLDPEVTLSIEELSDINLKIQKFNENFDEQDFSPVYQVKTEIDNMIRTVYNQNKMAQLDQMIASGDTSQFYISQAPDDGIITYNVDGFEELKADAITERSFDRSKYIRQELSNNDKVKAGEPAYKLITSENWSIVVPLTEELAAELKDTTLVKVKMLKDNELMWANFSIVNLDNAYYGNLQFDNSMIRYASERFLDIELIMEDESGLKIPKTSKITKDFYVVDKEYVTQGGNGAEAGVNIQTKGKRGAKSTEFLPIEVYNETDDGLCYLDPNAFGKNMILVKPETQDTLELKNMKKLEGVYNINKGYAVFKQINILCESDEYYIVEEGNAYSLSNYDHIVLDGKSVKENDVIFR